MIMKDRSDDKKILSETDDIEKDSGLNENHAKIDMKMLEAIKKEVNEKLHQVNYFHTSYTAKKVTREDYNKTRRGSLFLHKANS